MIVPRAYAAGRLLYYTPAALVKNEFQLCRICTKIPEIICILLPIAFCSVVVYNYIVRLRNGKQLACENNFKNLQKNIDKFK